MDLTLEISFPFWSRSLEGSFISKLVMTYQTNSFLRDVVLDLIKRNKFNSKKENLKRLVEISEKYQEVDFFIFELDTNSRILIDIYPGS